jgi:hypothetical protein
MNTFSISSLSKRENSKIRGDMGLSPDVTSVTKPPPIVSPNKKP